MKCLAHRPSRPGAFVNVFRGNAWCYQEKPAVGELGTGLATSFILFEDLLQFLHVILQICRQLEQCIGVRGEWFRLHSHRYWQACGEWSRPAGDVSLAPTLFIHS